MELVFKEMEEKYLSKLKDIYNYYIENTTATFHYYPMNDEGMREIVFFDELPYKTFVILNEDSVRWQDTHKAQMGDKGQVDSQDGTGNETVCGYVLLTRHKSREAYNITAEVTIYLHPDFVGKGIGRKALQFIEEYAHTTTLHTLVATICGENEESLKLFEKNGWEKCAHYKEVGMKFGRLLDLVACQKIMK